MFLCLFFRAVRHLVVFCYCCRLPALEFLCKKTPSCRGCIISAYFCPKTNKHFERHLFRSCTQDSGETIHKYVTRLRTLAETCQFNDTSEESVDQIIEKCASNKLRKRLLREPALDLEALLTIAQAGEAADRQARTYRTATLGQRVHSSDEDISEEVHRIQFKRKQQNRSSQQQRSSNLFVNRSNPTAADKPTTACYRCGSQGHFANKCEITKGKTSRTCGKTGHFSSVCQSRPSSVEYLHAETDENDSSSSEYSFVVDPNTMQDALYTVAINLCPCKVLIDSGSTVNIMSISQFRKISPTTVLAPYNKHVYTYSNREPLPIEGSFKADIVANNKNMNVTLLVINSAALTILSRPTAISLDILRLGPLVHTNSVNSISIDHMRDNLFDEYNDRFTGLGQLKDTAITIHVDETIHPVAQRPRRLPIQMIKEVDAEIDKLLDLGVLEPVKKPPSWINPLVVVPKKKGI